MKYKKAQISKTLMWIVATIIIIIILAVSIIITATFGRRTYKDIEFMRETDLFATKSLTSYLLTEDDSGKNVFQQIKEEEKLIDFNGNLAKKIFNELYGDEYNVKGLFFNPIWLGVSGGGTIEERRNDFFGLGPVVEKQIDYNKIPHVLEKIKLKEKKWVELFLFYK